MKVWVVLANDSEGQFFLLGVYADRALAESRVESCEHQTCGVTEWATEWTLDGEEEGWDRRAFDGCLYHLQEAEVSNQ